ncbi:MAG: cytosine-C5 methyltransferase protein [Devosia sp.]|jgi:DNA (cytosine-5)-methyltransferase 1|nr:cytosine-C5 methyltransferase protein [Devosia sp.]
MPLQDGRNLGLVLHQFQIVDMSEAIQIVDLFSGPGGLGEGFSSLPGKPFEIAVSIEKEASAHRTLRLRAFLRKFQEFPSAYYHWLETGTAEPDWASLYPEEWAAADHEALCLELGKPDTDTVLAERLAPLKGGRTILIGGPPCQAYSLVGRSRNAGIVDYDPATDHRNFLYDEYVKVLSALKPMAFVMENVKGMLSAAVKGSDIFEAVLRDLRAAGYTLYALAPQACEAGDGDLRPRDFIVKAEEFGIPQARHRVIILGMRDDVAERWPRGYSPRMLRAKDQTTVQDALVGMPRIRSGLSRGDGAQEWLKAVEAAAAKVLAAIANFETEKSIKLKAKLDLVTPAFVGVSSTGRRQIARIDQNTMPADLRDWLLDPQLSSVPNHDSRGHMESDLARYLFVSLWGAVFGISPKASDFPADLAPDHANWESGKFADRFRVQLANKPATTVTSHISKDGHYFIHPDPTQCRSLTVREAARLQTFPDNYAFLGNRTQQFVQVGNAVPPLLARRIGEVVLKSLSMAGV